MHRRPTAHSSVCSWRTAQTRGIIAASLGKMPIHSVPALDLLIDPLQRIGGVDLAPVLGREGHGCQHIVLSGVHAIRNLGEAPEQGIGNFPALSVGGLLVLLRWSCGG